MLKNILWTFVIRLNLKFEYKPNYVTTVQIKLVVSQLSQPRAGKFWRMLCKSCIHFEKRKKRAGLH